MKYPIFLCVGSIFCVTNFGAVGCSGEFVSESESQTVTMTALGDSTAHADLLPSNTGGLPTNAVPPASSCTTTAAEEDKDGDGIPAGLDCDDYNSDTYPGAYELCDYEDNDCNGEIDENWKIIFGKFFGQPCSSQALNGCVSEGIWSCDASHDWIECDASPETPSPEKCNGLDDDCNGITDTDAWPQLHTCCNGTTSDGPFIGTWECDSYSEDIACAATYEDDEAPATCGE